MFGAQTQLIVADRVIPEREPPRPVAAGLYGDLTSSLSALAAVSGPEHQAWIGELRAAETAARDQEKAELADDRTPLHPMRVYAELAPMLDRDAIVVIDGGDFGSYAGRVIDSVSAGLLAGQRALRLPRFGTRICAGRQTRPTRPSGRPAARRRRLRVQRHGVGHPGPAQRAGRLGGRQQRYSGPGKHPMEALYGYSVVAELRPVLATTRWREHWVRTASWCPPQPSFGPRWNVPLPAAYRPSSTS